MTDFKSKKYPKIKRSDLELMKKLNLNYTKWSNKTYPVGNRDMLYILSPSKVTIDYMALYSNPKEYHKTANTAVCFYEYDNVFDNKNGLWNAIYYNETKLLEKFKERFANVKYFIMPDYSLFGNGLDPLNAYNLQRARIVAIWLVCECNALVIPNITYADESSFDYVFDGLEDCEVVALSMKGSMINHKQLELLTKAIHQTIIRLTKLNTIIVYSTSTNNSKIFEIFNEAIIKGINIQIPDNILKNRNLISRGMNYGKI